MEQSCYHGVRKTKATARQDEVMKEREGCPPLSSDSRTKEIYGDDNEVTFNTILSLSSSFSSFKNYTLLMHITCA